MTDMDKDLWNKISAFQIDEPGTKFSFSDRVARENGWSKAYTNRVIEEYKKFIYLCCVSDKGVTPSDPVDQVWHLHLTYTKSYRMDFCKNTIGKDIHHNPTKGGESEAKKFDNYYTHLKEIYRHHFSTDPPPDIWQTNEVRFGDIDFQRVNLKKYWLIKKPGQNLFASITLFLIIIAGVISIQAKEFPAAIVIFIVFMAGIIIYAVKNKGKGDGNSSSGGCGTSGCATSHGHHSGDSGCSSGCSSSGCSGCGGGD